MNPKIENIKKWIEALESGKYQQGTGNLVTTVGDIKKYCCLGVACELALQSGVQMKVTQGEDMMGFSNEFSILPFRVRVWLGLDGDPVILESPRVGAISANDRRKWSFAKIASALRHTYLGEKLPENFGEMS